MPKPDITEELIGKKTGDANWGANFKNFGGDRKAYDKYFEDGELKEGYSTRGYIGGSEKVFENRVRGEMAGTKDGRYRKEGRTFEIYKLPEQKAAPAPAAPMPDSVAEEVEDPNTLVQLSNRAAAANAGTAAYEQALLNMQGSAAILGDKGPEQAFKNQYQSNLTEELKAKDPTALATAKAKYELNDAQAANLQDEFSLNLGAGSLFG